MTEAAQTKSPDLQVIRETIESLAVAFILALLFKAFIAEAFVIPTGSMAPTLMGAHKDVKCEECGYQYQCGASNEFDRIGNRKVGRDEENVIGTTCPLCRKPQVANKAVNSNHATFSGDRILVSKLAYVWSQPRRWDVIVFKFIEDARLNYIKRCIGRPNETIRIREGNIYVKDNQKPLSEIKPGVDAAASSFEIARKPPHVMNAMLQVIYDSKYVPSRLVKAGMPSYWQPFPANASSWQVNQTETKWSASIAKAQVGKISWLRYYHRVIDPLAWQTVESTGALPAPIPPESSRLVMDFTAYNAGYSAKKAEIDADKFQARAEELIRSRNLNGPLENDGIHWTGDLAADFEIKTDRDCQTLALLLVEAGVEHECRIDLKTGQATMTVLVGGLSVQAFQQDGGTAASQAMASTSIRAGGKHRVRFANVDDTLVLWVDGKPIKWSPSGNLLSELYIPYGARVPKSSPANPLDAAPIAIGVEGGGAEILRAQAFRDIYYISHTKESPGLSDYPDLNGALRQSSTPENNARYAREVHNLSTQDLNKKMSQEAMRRNALLSNANLWACSPMASTRRTVEFTMEEDWYFPMGDNSAASSDARSWGEHHTPERLFIGRAVMVFWPHYWNAPVPFLPNVQRMGLIR